MGSQHKQEDYNDALRECEMCMVLYWTRFGLYTKTELDTAYYELKAGHNPRRVYVCFKDADAGTDVSADLKAFRDSFPTEYGCMADSFRNPDTLKSLFLLQLMDYLKASASTTLPMEVKDGNLYIGGKKYVQLANVPFVGNNEAYTDLLKTIKRTKTLLAMSDPADDDYAEIAAELRALEEKREKMESSLWSTALDITRLSNERCSERLRHAIELFNQGDNRGASAILNEAEICHKADQNVKRIIELKTAEENLKTAKEGLKTSIEELKLKIETLKAEKAEGWREEVLDLRQKVVEFTKKAFGEQSEEYAEAMRSAGEA